MTCERCGQAENDPGVLPRVEVSRLSIRVNGTFEVLGVRLCQVHKDGLLRAIRRSIEPVGRAAA